MAAIKERYAEYEARNRKNRPNKKLVEILADMEDDDDVEVWALMVDD